MFVHCRGHREGVDSAEVAITHLLWWFMGRVSTARFILILARLKVNKWPNTLSERFLHYYVSILKNTFYIAMLEAMLEVLDPYLVVQNLHYLLIKLVYFRDFAQQYGSRTSRVMFKKYTKASCMHSAH